MQQVVKVSDYPTFADNIIAINQTDHSLMEQLVDVDPDAAVILLNNYSETASGDGERAMIPIAVAIARKEGLPWSDIDWTEIHRPCGGSKCMYKSRSDPSLGYLITRRNKGILRMMEAYAREQDLVERFDIPSTIVEKPHIVHNVSSHMMSLLYAYQHALDQNRNLIVQKVRIVPNPSLLIGLCKLAKGNLNLARYHQRIETFITLIREHGDVEGFRKQYQNELSKALKIVNEPKYFCLFKDFQVIVDLTGKWYYIDLDRGGGKAYNPYNQHAERKVLLEKQLMAGMNKVLDWFTVDTSLAAFAKRDQKYVEFDAC
jgi:hypothetical protein